MYRHTPDETLRVSSEVYERRFKEAIYSFAAILSHLIALFSVSKDSRAARIIARLSESIPGVSNSWNCAILASMLSHFVHMGSPLKLGGGSL